MNEQLKQAIEEAVQNYQNYSSARHWTKEHVVDCLTHILCHVDPKIMKQVGLVREDELVKLVQSLKDYTRESRSILGFDDRDASEFVDIYFKKPQP